MRTSYAALACGAVALLAGCNQAGLGEKSKVAAAIDAGLIKNAVCERLPIDVATELGEVSRSTYALKHLQERGLIEPKTLQGKDPFGRDKQVQGFVTTQSGKSLIQEPATMNSWGLYTLACIRAGRYKVKSIEAVDEASDALGGKVASVRARIVFEPEAWFADTRTAPEMARIWNSAQSNEQQQWMYRLTKSGGDYFFTGPGSKL